MARPIEDLDVPLPVLIAELVARQNEQRAEESAQRLRQLLTPSPNTTSQEGQ
ncbi:hypothetical protein ACIRU8_39010 [Streptomyces sp. NPDC101175]|uniref:hypothetical protein n=1 Tax=Streptomyces sp. NPDC101175 TaxID=3366123 RepID=UPI003832DFEE